MHALVLDEAAAPQVLALQQAFVSGGDVVHNVFGLHEEFASSLDDARLRQASTHTLMDSQHVSTMPLTVGLVKRGRLSSCLPALRVAYRVSLSRR